jgi:hypothetical protein
MIRDNDTPPLCFLMSNFLTLPLFFDSIHITIKGTSFFIIRYEDPLFVDFSANRRLSECSRKSLNNLFVKTNETFESIVKFYARHRSHYIFIGSK